MDQVSNDSEKTSESLSETEALVDDVIDQVRSDCASIAQITDSITTVLSIPNAAATLKASEATMEITDDTDLEKAAKFDIFAYMEARGLKFDFLEEPEI